MPTPIEKRVPANSELPANNVAITNFVFMILPPAMTEALRAPARKVMLTQAFPCFRSVTRWFNTTSVDDPGQNVDKKGALLVFQIVEAFAPGVW